MQPVSPAARQYDPATIAFHWITAILVATQWLGAQTIDWFPRGPLRVDARSVHIVMGALLALILVARVAWRLTRGRRLPPADRGARNLAAKATHWVLYTLLAAMTVAGLALTWQRADSLFNMVRIPGPGNRDLAEQILQVHAAIGYLILALAGLHAAAALMHRYLWHDAVLARMLPHAQVSSQPAEAATARSPARTQ